MKKTILLSLFATLFSLSSWAKDKQAVTPEPTKIAAELQVAIYKAQSNAYAAQLNLLTSQQYKAVQETTAAQKAVMDMWAKACGDSFVPGRNSETGDPVCTEKPKEKPTPTLPNIEKQGISPTPLPTQK